MKLYLPAGVAVLIFIFFCSYLVEKNATGKLYTSVENIPKNKVGLLLGTCKTMKDRKTINPFWKFRVAHRGQLSNQIIERFSKIYELKGVLNVSMLEPALLSGGCKVAI